MKNTYDEQIACIRHLKAGGKLEVKTRHKGWYKSNMECPGFDTFKYRPLVEKYQPEQGEMVMVIGYDKKAEILPRQFKFMDGDKYVCVADASYYFAWPGVKPIEQPKLESREWWVTTDTQNNVLDVQQYKSKGMIKVREVLE